MFMKRFLIMAAMVSTMLTVANAQNVSGNCYRGFVDAGYTFGLGDYKFGRIEVNTSHGFQINPYIFVGGGAGFHFMSSYKTPDMDIPLDKRDSKVDIPIFANIRANLSKGKITPFIDFRGGMFVTNSGGLYVHGAVGCRFATNEKQAFNISVGFSLEKLEFESFGGFISSKSMEYYRTPRKLEANGLTIKLGYEF